MTRLPPPYVIHYTKLIDRKKNLEDAFLALDINPIYIVDYDQEDLSKDIIDHYYQWNESEYKKKLENLWHGVLARPLVLPEISCTIKHLEAIKLISEGDNEFGLILEDDVVFCEDFEHNFNLFLDNTPLDWNAIFFGSGCGEQFIRQNLDESKRVNEYCFKPCHPATNCAEAYLIKKETAIQIFNSTKPFHMISDWEIAYQLYKFNSIVYWWVPSLIEQGSKNGMYSSTLDLGQRV